MRVVLTGSCGAVGRSVSAALTAAGHDVLGLDVMQVNPRLGPDPLAAEGRWRRADLRDRSQIDPHLAGADAIVHLGEIPNHYGDPPEVVFATNTLIGANVFTAAADAGVPRVVYASTAQTYGFCGNPRRLPAYLPVDEAHPQRGQNAYALSKIANERFAAAVAHGRGVSVAAVRLPGVTSQGSLQWIRRRLRHGDDRAPCDVQDLGAYVLGTDAGEAFTRLAADHRPGFEAYNLAAPGLACRYTLGELIDAFGQDDDTPAAWRDEKPAVPDPSAREVFDCSKIEAHLGWRPAGTMQDVLGDLVAS